jgi:hypothetical protein
MTLINTTLSEQLAHAYIATRLDETRVLRTALRSTRRGRTGRRRAVAPDQYTDYLTARGEAIR